MVTYPAKVDVFDIVTKNNLEMGLTSTKNLYPGRSGLCSC